MTAPWHKVYRDIWRERSRAAVVVLAIAIGLAAFFAVLSTYAVLRRELNREYLATNPASAVLVTDAVDEALLASMSARNDLDDVDARRVLNGRMVTAAGRSRRLTLFVIRDFEQLRISTVSREPGASWPPAPGEILIERDAFQVAKATTGDVVTVELRDGGRGTLRVAGGVHDVGQAQARMENTVYAYITPASLGRLGLAPTLDRLYLLAGGNRFDESHVHRVAADVKTAVEAAGHPVTRMNVPPPGEHPHAIIMGLLLLVMAAFGVVVLALSGVIVLNLLLAMMAGERRQIGVLKAIGGTRRQIVAIYLAEAAAFGVAAMALATPAGVAGGRALTRYLAVLLNFDIVSLAVPAWVYLLVGVVGLLVPLAAAAYPVAAATALTVREALAPAGVEPATFGLRRLDRWFSAVSGVIGPLLLGVRNSLRRPTRTVLTVGTLTAAGTSFVAALSARTSLMAEVDRQFGAGTFGSADRYSIDQHMLMIYVFLLIVAGVLGAVGGLGLMTATSLNVLDRRRELGVLRAIGASPRMVGAIVIVEAVFVAVVSWIGAVLVGWLVTAGICRLARTIFFPRGVGTVLDPLAVAGWLAISLVLSMAASLVPASSASRRSVREALSYE